jgi:hypothetical protein
VERSGTEQQALHNLNEIQFMNVKLSMSLMPLLFLQGDIKLEVIKGDPAPDKTLWASWEESTFSFM